MRGPQSFQQDCIELARERLERGEIDRRSFLKGLAALGVLPALAAGDAARAADAKEIVIANWGGLANEGFSRFYGQPFEKDHAGAKVTTDSGGPAGGKIRAMVESGHVTWDLCDSSASSAYWLGGLGLLEPIDYKVVDKANVPPVGFALPHGVAPYSFSTVLAYDKAKVGDVPPKTWADFWDLKKYPGRRLLRHDALSTLELAVMAAGVPLEKVYPIDIKLALDKIKEIKEHCLYWSSGAESEQIIRTGEAVMGGIWHTRASVLSRESNDRMSWTWNQGVLQAGIFVVPKGNPAGALAQELLASMTAKVEPQIGLLGLLGNGPSNPKASALVPPELRRFNPTDPDNAKGQVVNSGEWWGANYPDANAKYVDTISS
ncbi:MAG TPA: ABC transporter substrate-binding protein [Alphaproteobacteria bacterium]|nr:ABC transporter substrate-binding protein [Alphaproteobacteria bacterium]